MIFIFWAIQCAFSLKLVRSADKTFQKYFEKYLERYLQMQNFMMISNLVKKLEKILSRKSYNQKNFRSWVNKENPYICCCQRF